MKRVLHGGNRPRIQVCPLAQTFGTKPDRADVLTIFSVAPARTMLDMPRGTERTADLGGDEIVGMENFVTRLDEHADGPEPVPTLPRPSDVAARLGVSRTWLYDAAKDGRIPSIRLGAPDGTLRFVPGDVRDWIEAGRAASRQPTRRPPHRAAAHEAAANALRRRPADRFC